MIDISTTAKTTAAQYTYDPYGRLIASSGTYKDYNDYLFSTKRYERQWGLNYYGYRFYSADLGRWITRDPIGEDGGLNLYGFVGNGPVVRIDVLGTHTYIKDQYGEYRSGLNEPKFKEKNCCGGKFYDMKTHCCCKGGTLVENSMKGKKVSRTKIIDTKIKRFEKWAPVGSNEGHTWFEFPDSTSIGFNYYNNRLYLSPDPMSGKLHIELENRQKKGEYIGCDLDEVFNNVNKEIYIVEACKINAQKFKDCLQKERGTYTGFLKYYKNSYDCKAYADRLIADCLQVSKGCTEEID